jgi:hypothetical protein
VFEQSESGTPRDLSFAAADRFLKKAADYPRIGGNRFARQGRMGIDLAGEPPFGFTENIAHDVFRRFDA